MLDKKYNHKLVEEGKYKSWLDKKMVLRSKLTKPFHRIFGTNCFNWLKKN